MKEEAKAKVKELVERCSTSQYIRIDRESDILYDRCCFTDKGLMRGKSPILLM
jgi:hypothetical protein